MTAFSDYLENKLGDHSLGTAAFTMPTTVYLALFTDAPGDTGGTEVTGGSYARQVVTFDAFVAGVASNDVALTFPSMPAVSVVGWGIYDALTSGNLLYKDSWDNQPIAYTAGQDATLAIGDLTITLD